eukprot:TRINITY_DN9662_c0_g1_i2.p1 TRINITY_DN9662_c0_g1~~TRINITY_DN9662_c0_g1_i2.p1  ORF type:complete len:327 (+),score=55.41 TRINITY_DN9662_c0_g1_i2:112-1092(+)
MDKARLSLRTKAATHTMQTRSEYAHPPKPRTSSQSISHGTLYAHESIQRYAETLFPTHDSHELHLCIWTPQFSFQHFPLATVFVVHSLYADKHSLFDVCNRLAAAGLRVISVDLRGHGRTSGNTDDLPIAETLLDIELLIESYSVPALPNFLYGHGFGATLCIAIGLKQISTLSRYDSSTRSSDFADVESDNIGIDGDRAVIESAEIEPTEITESSRSSSVSSFEAVGDPLKDAPPEYSFSDSSERRVKLHGVIVTSPWFSMAQDSNTTQKQPGAQTREANKKPTTSNNSPPNSLVEAWYLADLCRQSAADFTLPLLLIHGEADQV